MGKENKKKTKERIKIILIHLFQSRELEAK